MTGCGTTTYTDPDDYRVMPGTAIDMVLTGGEGFKARVTWVKMRYVTLALIEETAPRIAYLSLARALTFLCFPLRGEPIWNGTRMRRGDFVLLGGGQHLHQLAAPGTRWAIISIRSRDLAVYSRTLLGQSLPPIRQARIIRPSSKVANRLLRLVGEACRLAASRHDLMAHREVARAVGQDLIHRLVNALNDARSDQRNGTMRRHADIMVRFEEALANQHSRPSMPAISVALGVPQRTLRICCEEFLGCSPLAYARLKRLNRARAMLSRADHVTSIAEIARSHGFPEPGRFATAYRALFGETPSATLLRNSAESA